MYGFHWSPGAAVLFHWFLGQRGWGEAKEEEEEKKKSLLKFQHRKSKNTVRSLNLLLQMLAASFCLAP